LNLKWTAAKKGKVISVMVGGKQNTGEPEAGENAHDKCSCWHQISPPLAIRHSTFAISTPCASKSRRPAGGNPGNPSRAQSIISTANANANFGGEAEKRECGQRENPKQTEKLWIFTPFAIKMPPRRH